MSLVNVIFLALSLMTVSVKGQQTNVDPDEPPDGYYAFFESPNAVPPKVRPPPYVFLKTDCKNANSKKTTVSVHNICGDLNKGYIYRNPMEQNVHNEPYPFELIRNHTLKFFSKSLPILRADDTLPKVKEIKEAFVEDIHQPGEEPSFRSERAVKYYENHKSNTSVPLAAVRQPNIDARQPRKICENGGVFCALYRAINGDGTYQNQPQFREAEKREDIGNLRYEGPPTPCPAKVEYATPVFAKNYQGTWRYVVQIPYEGYFTQTVEVTRCLQARCHYLDGGCLSSPRWVSLLVAEIFYPNNETENSEVQTTTPSIQDFQSYQKFLQQRVGAANEPTNSPAQHCDGQDETGCYQIRLYFDWFLIPGSCKCWRPDYFSKYVRRKQS